MTIGSFLAAALCAILLALPTGAALATSPIRDDGPVPIACVDDDDPDAPVVFCVEAGTRQETWTYSYPTVKPTWYCIHVLFACVSAPGVPHTGTGSHQQTVTLPYVTYEVGSPSAELILRSAG